MTEDQKKYQFNTNSNKKSNTDVKIRGLKSDSQLWRELKAQAALLGIPIKLHVIDILKRHLKNYGTMSGTTEPKKHKEKKLDSW